MDSYLESLSQDIPMILAKTKYYKIHYENSSKITQVHLDAVIHMEKVSLSMLHIQLSRWKSSSPTFEELQTIDRLRRLLQQANTILDSIKLQNTTSRSN